MERLKIGDFVAAKTEFPIRITEEDVQYHRGRVTEIVKFAEGERKWKMFRVFFVVSCKLLKFK